MSYETNKWDVKNRVRSGAWKVAEGREITETDLIQGTVAAGISIYTGDATAFVTWVENLVRESITQLSTSIQREVSDAARQQSIDLANRTIRRLISGRSAGVELLNIGNVQFKAGVSKYTGRNRTWIPNPFSRDGGYWQTLSTTHAWQPYVAFRLSSNSSGPSDQGQGGNDSHVRNAAKEYIEDKWGEGYDLTGMFCGGGRAAVVMTNNAGYSAQSFLISDSYPNEFISNKFREGYHVTNLSCHAGQWSAVMSKDTGYTAQWRRYHSDIADFISEKFDEGNRITQLTYGDGKWSVVMMGNTGITGQYWRTSNIYPSDWISELFRDGYRLTSLSCEGGMWAAVMSKGSNHTAQWRIVNAAFPADFIRDKWDDRNDITSITHGDGVWGAVLLGNTGWGAQSYRYWQ